MAGSDGPDGPGALVRLARVSAGEVSVDEVLAAVRDDGAGGTCVFVGTVRDVDHDRDVSGLEYSAHPSAPDGAQEVCRRVADRWASRGVLGVAAVHRVGELAIGDVAVAVAACAVHREEAFGAARELIDAVKAEVAIWKRQTFADGASEWVGIPWST